MKYEKVGKSQFDIDNVLFKLFGVNGTEWQNKLHKILINNNEYK